MTADLRKAERLFQTFHQYNPTKVGDFRSGFSIPRKAKYVGEAKTMFYSSDKLNPETGEDEGWIHYYHDHGSGVRMYVTDDSQSGEVRNIPKWIYGAKALVRLGDCEGFEYTGFDGKTHEAKSVGRNPEWYSIPSGKALLAIQDKREILAIAWGGDLAVGWRGVMG